MPDSSEERQYAPECYACPIGTVSMAMQGAAPDATEHILRAGREMLQAFRSVLDGMDAFLAMMEERGGAARQPAPVETIPIRRKPGPKKT
jgi:hypothetical protein